MFVFMALSNEDRAGGEGEGVVVVDAAEGNARFTPLVELRPAELCDRLREQMQANPEQIFILSKTAEHMHVFNYPRQRALDELKAGVLPLAQ